MGGFRERLAGRLVSAGSLGKGQRGDFIRAVKELEKAGFGVIEILAVIQLIIFLLDAAGPLIAKIKELIDAMRKRKVPEFARRKGIEGIVL